MPTTEEWTAAIIFNTVHIILSILIIYYFIRFYRFRHTQALQKRHPPLVYLQNLCILFYVIQCILYKFAYIYNDGHTATGISHNHASIGYVLKLLSEIFYILSSHGMLLTFAARSYIIYFNINWAIEMQKSKWSIHLNSDLSSFWFLRHHNDFGSKRYIYSFVFIYYIIVSIVVSILLTTNLGIEGFIGFFLFGIEVISIFIIWNKIPRFHDVYHVKKEIKIANYLALSALLLYIIWLIKLTFIGYQLWSFMIFQFFFGFLVGLIAIVVNTYIFSKNCIHLIEGEEPLINIGQQTVGKITDTLCSDELLPLFFKHLSDEFSVEVLLGFVEFIEFNNMMQNNDDFMVDILQHNGNGYVEQIRTFCNKFAFPSELPVSNIIHEKHQNITNNIHKYLFIARDLYDKYINSGSEFEINIGYNCKQAIVDFIRNYCNNLYWSDTDSDQSVFTLNELEKYRLFSLYYDACIELHKLMLHSHRRFIRAIFSDKDFRVDTQQNIALKEIKSNQSLQEQISNSITKKTNIVQTLKNRLSENSGKNKLDKKEINAHLVHHDALDVQDDIPTFSPFSLSAPTVTLNKRVKKEIQKSFDDSAINMDGVLVDVASDSFD